MLGISKKQDEQEDDGNTCGCVCLISIPDRVFRWVSLLHLPLFVLFLRFFAVVLLCISVHSYQSNWLVTIPPEGYTKYKQQKKKKARWVKLSSSTLHVSFCLFVCSSFLCAFIATHSIYPLSIHCSPYAQLLLTTHLQHPPTNCMFAVCALARFLAPSQDNMTTKQNHPQLLLAADIVIYLFFAYASNRNNKRRRITLTHISLWIFHL